MALPPVGRGLLGDLARRRAPLRIDDVQAAAGFTGWPDGHPDMCAFLGVPIRVPGATIGSLYMTRLRGRPPFTRAEEASASIMALQIAATISRLRLNDAIARRDRELQELFTTSPAAIFVTDLETERLLAFNAASEALTGFTAAEAVGRTTVELGTWADPEARVAIFRRYARREPVHGAEVKIRTRNGDTVDVIASTAYVTFRGKPAIVTALQDITEARRAAWLRERLDREQSLATLAGGIAHDFNNVLTTMVLTLDLLEMEHHDPATEEMLRELRTAAGRAQALAGAMLTYAGASGAEMAVVDLNALVRRVRRDVEADFRGTANSFDVQTWPAALPVRGDGGQIELVVRSLVANAREALRTSNASVQVSTSNANLDVERAAHVRPPLPAGTYAAVRVSDTGAGMDAGTVEKMFDPFFSTKFPGRGLGLASALGVARLHGGGFDVASVPGDGTSVTLYLPIAHRE